jgi:hypothetical protein
MASKGVISPSRIFFEPIPVSPIEHRQHVFTKPGRRAGISSRVGQQPLHTTSSAPGSRRPRGFRKRDPKMLTRGRYGADASRTGSTKPPAGHIQHYQTESHGIEMGVAGMQAATASTSPVP